MWKFQKYPVKYTVILLSNIYIRAWLNNADSYIHWSKPNRNLEL